MSEQACLSSLSKALFWCANPSPISEASRGISAADRRVCLVSFLRSLDESFAIDAARQKSQYTRVRSRPTALTPKTATAGTERASCSGTEGAFNRERDKGLWKLTGERYLASGHCYSQHLSRWLAQTTKLATLAFYQDISSAQATRSPDHI